MFPPCCRLRRLPEGPLTAAFCSLAGLMSTRWTETQQQLVPVRNPQSPGCRAQTRSFGRVNGLDAGVASGVGFTVLPGVARMADSLVRSLRRGRGPAGDVFRKRIHRSCSSLAGIRRRVVVFERREGADMSTGSKASMKNRGAHGRSARTARLSVITLLVLALAVVNVFAFSGI